MQNKTLVGVVFGLVGALVLILIIIISTFALRRRRSRKLTEEAISFDPATVGGGERYGRLDFAEKARMSLSSSGHSSGHGHTDARNPFMDSMKQGGQYMSASMINSVPNALHGHNSLPPWPGLSPNPPFVESGTSRVPENISSNFASSTRLVNDSVKLDLPDLDNYKSQSKGLLKIANE